MKISRRHTLTTLALAAAASGLATPALAHDNDDDYRSDMVFTSSNEPSGNQLLVYAKSERGGLVLRGRVATGGYGSGAGLGSQGAVTLSDDGRYVYVVNAQSNSLSTFELRPRGPALMSVVASNGLHPISVTENNGIVYVLNDGGSGNVAGFRNQRGELKPIAGSNRPLSVAGGAAPAQIGFSDSGDALVVSEKGTNKLTSYAVAYSGSIGAPIVSASAGITPFGFAFNRRNRLIVTEAVGGAAGASTVSSYAFSAYEPARPVVVSAKVPDTQSAACWVAVTPNGRWAYVANTGSSTVSSYTVANSGQIALAEAAAGSTGAGSAPADTAVSADGRQLYVRNGVTATISSFRIRNDGSLSAAAPTTGLPAHAVGLAAN